MEIVEVRSRAKELTRISAPVIAEQFFVMLMGLISSVMVAYLGEQALAAVSMVESVSNMILAFYAALTTGGTIVVAQYIGKKDFFKAKEAAGQAFLLTVAISVVMSVFLLIFGRWVIDITFSSAELIVRDFAYQFLYIVTFSYPFIAIAQTAFGVMRGSGDARTPLFISVVMNIVNVVFGFILIRGLDLGFMQIPGLGIVGAGLGLLIARVAGFLLCAYFIVFKVDVIRLDKSEFFKSNRSSQRAILRLGVPTSVESVLFQLGKLITVVFVVNMSTNAISANAIGMTLLNMVSVVGSGFATGVMVLCGQKIGRGEVDDIKRTTFFAGGVSIVLMSTVCLLMFIFFDQIIGLYDVEIETYNYLRILLFSAFTIQAFLWPWSFLTPAALRAVGDVRYTMTFSILSMWVARIGLGYILGIVLNFGVIGVWAGMYADWMFRGIFFNARLINGKWKGKGL